MTEVHHGYAGHGEILPHELIDAATSTLQQPRPVQDLQMFDAAFVAAPAHRREFGNRPCLAAGQFLEHLPARQLADGPKRLLEVGQRPARDIFESSGIWIHGENLKTEHLDVNSGFPILSAGWIFIQEGMLFNSEGVLF